MCPPASASPSSAVRRQRAAPESPYPQSAPFGREKHANLPFVLLVKLPPDQPTRLEPLDERCDRAGVEEQSVPQRLNSQSVLFPQHQKDQILRIREASGLKAGLVEAREGVLGRIDGEAEHGIKRERISLLGHGTSPLPLHRNQR